MVPRRSRTRTSKSVESITHEEAKRRNLPSAEHQPRLSEAIGQSGMLEEWEIPRDAAKQWPRRAKKLHAAWWKQRIARQEAIDDSIARNAEFEYLYDKPYEHRNKVRVAGPFTVESVSPHRMLEMDENDEIIDRVADSTNGYGTGYDFAQIILEADEGQIQVRVNGVDVFHPNSGEVRSDGPDGIACWFIDTDYTRRHSSFATPTSSAPTIRTDR